jgi:hypothetical protein
MKSYLRRGFEGRLEQHFAQEFNNKKDARMADDRTHSKANTWSNNLVQLLDAFGMSEDRTQQALQLQQIRLEQSASSGNNNPDRNGRQEYRTDASAHRR